MTTPLITSRTDWNRKLLQEVWGHIEDVAVNDLGLTFYQPQIEIVSAEQMLDAYSSTGMPVNYSHWSFGKDYLRTMKQYQKGHTNLAYEMIIQTNPAITYIMEENDAVMQTLVLSHACAGHGFVFKNNYLFKDLGMAESLVDYMIYARDFVHHCEEKYGEDEVEKILDCAHTLSRNSIDKYERKNKRPLTEEEKLLEDAKRAADNQKELDIIIKTTTEDYRSTLQQNKAKESVDVDEENLLYFIAENSIILKPWQREVLNIVRRISQSFYPQMQTKLLHEGFATFTHSYIMNELEQRGIISPDAEMSWIHSHSSVIYQPDMRSKYYTGSFNPYSLGLSLFRDIRRICEEPTKEDERWFPNLVGRPWREEIRKAASDYNDESLVAQFLSPNLMRKYKMMLVKAYGTGDRALVTEICDDAGYEAIRKNLSCSYNPINHVPEITVKKADLKKDRYLQLEYSPYNGRRLDEGYANDTLRAIMQLWGYNVILETKPLSESDLNGSDKPTPFEF